MNKNIKAILLVYTVILACLMLSAMGLMIINLHYGLIYLSLSIVSTPLLSLITILLQLNAMKKAK